jgi:hypothetical protein
MENQGQHNFDPERFDFCIHRRKRNQTHRVKPEITPEMPKKIKTLLPKTKASSTPDTLLTTVTNSFDSSLNVSTPTSSTPDGGKFFVICYLLIHVIVMFNLCDMSFTFR